MKQIVNTFLFKNNVQNVKTKFCNLCHLNTQVHIHNLLTLISAERFVLLFSLIKEALSIDGDGKFSKFFEKPSSFNVHSLQRLFEVFREC